ncbi:DUF3616 domain-containing protein [Ramlibacter rhizophilus]|uniref:DUF3616 domain-containing protein n=1 Tax=Ramlibacter rhizophilus TaxID=1781167 RepID=A0A4Z0BCP1_9BURK|nr:DUF3616 domain-containing protein [Ramlibacter rhizophilus]TFY96451.1 DUF3616 domain-containing protein [Ramlibacter rhizophilus]
MPAHAHGHIDLTFSAPLDDARGPRKELRDGLSAVRQIGRTLWLANDESASVERLTLDGDRAGAHEQFPLLRYLDLPEPADKEADTDEVDVEGLDGAGGYLWVVGSHSRKRSKPSEGNSPAEAVACLADVDKDPNRFLLARIPLIEAEGELPTLARKAKPRRAQRLRGDGKGNALTRLLRKDEHLGPFIGLPGKENGFDIEGIAVAGERVFVGLRGPVLRGWAVVLELRLQGDGRWLTLQPLDGSKKGACLRKHFLDLSGLGVRDLCLQGEDLLVLAGPTMDLDGPVRVLRWRDALRCDEASVVAASQLQVLLDLPYGTGCDHAEGMTLLRRSQDAAVALLVVHDSPDPARQPGRNSLRADVFALP